LGSNCACGWYRVGAWLCSWNVDDPMLWVVIPPKSTASTNSSQIVYN
jgi:hypothetical protein